MAASLLTTKLYMPPPRSHMVVRPRLLEKLDEGLRRGRRLTLVSAPAGYGKTTLVSEWLHLANVLVAWLSLDAGDNDLARFLTHLVAALQTVDNSIGQSTRGLLQSPVLPPLVELLTTLVNEIAAVPDPFVLVFDDYEALVELAVHEAATFLLAHQPAPLHLVLVTRHDPPLPLARLRARGQMSEVRARDLRFTQEEAAAFLRQTMGLDLTAEQVAILEAHTEGWVSGLQLAALSIQEDDDPDAFIRAFAGEDRHVRDYLMEEVFSRQPQAVQGFLLKTAVLDRLSGPLCDALLGGDTAAGSGQGMLERLESANLFLVPLDSRREWYRYHPLFADLLCHRLRRDRPEWVPGLHRRAALWYEQSGFAAESVQHALASQDYDLAADLIERAILGDTVWSSGDPTAWLAWLKALPEDLIRARPWLWLLSVRTHFVTDGLENADEILEEIEQSLLESPTANPDAERLLGVICADRAMHAVLRGQVRQARELARAALPRLPQDDILTQFRMLALEALASCRVGDVIEAARLLPQVIEMATEAGLPFAALGPACNLAEVYLLRGQLDQALQAGQQAVALGTKESKPLSAVGMVGLVLGQIYYQRNDLSAAERHLVEGLERLGQGGISDSFGVGHALLAQIRQARGDEQGARSAIEQAQQIARSSSLARLSSLVAAYRARLDLAQGRVDAAVRWAQDYRQTGAAEYLREFEDLTLVRVLLAVGELDAALALLEQLLVSAEKADRMGHVLEMEVLRALALEASGDENGAMEALARALSLGEPEGYVRVFLEGGPAMARLLFQAAARGIAPAYAGRLLAAFGEEQTREEPAASIATPGVSRAAPLVEPLSARELEVLQWIAAGLSNSQVAERLCLSIHTVKSHTYNLYGKLGVHSRVQAVRRARALGLIPPEDDR